MKNSRFSELFHPFQTCALKNKVTTIYKAWRRCSTTSHSWSYLGALPFLAQNIIQLDGTVLPRMLCMTISPYFQKTFGTNIATGGQTQNKTSKCLSPALLQNTVRPIRPHASVVAPQALGNKWNTVSRVLFRKRELTEFSAKLAKFCEKL